jgi:transposase
MKTQYLEITDEFWSRVEPLIPAPKRDETKTYKRKPGAGRKPKSARIIFEGILYVLKTGCQWKALPKERFGSASSIHRYFMEWEEAGFFEELWKHGLAESDELEGIPWRWQSIDRMMKEYFAAEAVGRNLLRGEKNGQAPRNGGGKAWRPVVDHRYR